MTSAICDLLEHKPANKEVADKLKGGHCPECNSEQLVRWCPLSGFHELCTHIHCMDCDSDFCWPIAWEPPMPVMKMKGELSPRDRRAIAKICKNRDIAIPNFWQPIMQSDLEAKAVGAILICYMCGKEKKTEVIVQAGHWHWGRGKHPRDWVGTDNEMIYSEQHSSNIIYAKCLECQAKVRLKP